MTQRSNFTTSKIMYQIPVLSGKPRTNVESQTMNTPIKNGFSRKLSIDETMRFIKSRIKLNKYFNTKGLDRNTSWEMVLADSGITSISSKELSIKWRSLLSSYKRLAGKSSEHKTAWQFYDLMDEYDTKCNKANEIDPGASVKTVSTCSITLNAAGEDTIVLSDEEDISGDSLRNNHRKILENTDLSSPATINRIDAKIDAFIDDLQKRNAKVYKKFDNTCKAIATVLKDKFNLRVSNSSESE